MMIYEAGCEWCFNFVSWMMFDFYCGLDLVKDKDLLIEDIKNIRVAGSRTIF